MTSFEDELTEAMAQTGAEVTGPPPLRLAAQYRARRKDWRARRRARWLVPAAAALSVAAIAAAAATVLAIQPQGPDLSTGQHPVDPSHPTRLVPDLSDPPPYYIALTGTPPYAIDSPGVGIYSTATGNVLTRVTLPAGLDVVGVSAASDDRTFVVAAADGHIDHLFRSERLEFYLLRFTANRARILHVTTSFGFVPLRGLALSPDGTKVAYAYTMPYETSVLKVLDLASGKAHTWKTAGDGLPMVPQGALSWASDNRTLAFNWYGAIGAGLRLLDTSAAGTAPGSDSRLAVPATSQDQVPEPQISTSGSAQLGNLLLAPAGFTAIAAVTYSKGGASTLARFSIRTGRLIATFDDGPATSTEVLWSDPAGKTMILWSPPGHPDTLAIVRSGRLTQLPAPGRIAFPSAAW